MHSSRTDVRGTTGSTEEAEQPRHARFGRGPWTVLGVVAAVLLGPAAATASALDQANKAPLHPAVRAEQTQAYLPTDTSRRRGAA
ncbi:hypothetical protein [Streptomyces shenzhenensis]|uniref:hypothetical protein n=1 Tax=Streptomyces shenzhenensis TaxID=943815 RepID=UPI0036BC527E